MDRLIHALATTARIYLDGVSTLASRAWPSTPRRLQAEAELNRFWG